MEREERSSLLGFVNGGINYPNSCSLQCLQQYPALAAIHQMGPMPTSCTSSSSSSPLTASTAAGSGSGSSSSASPQTSPTDSYPQASPTYPQAGGGDYPQASPTYPQGSPTGYGCGIVSGGQTFNDCEDVDSNCCGGDSTTSSRLTVIGASSGSSNNVSSSLSQMSVPGGLSDPLLESLDFKESTPACESSQSTPAPPPTDPHTALQNALSNGLRHPQSEVKERMRAILVDWIVEVHAKFRLGDETLYVSNHNLAPIGLKTPPEKAFYKRIHP